MKVLAIVHGYPPLHNAGAEWMLHGIMKDLQAKGHEVEVLVPGITEYDFDGISVRNDQWASTKPKMLEADLIMTHLRQAGRVTNMCKFYKKPMVQLIHNNNYYPSLTVNHCEHKVNQWAYVLYNSLYTKSEMNYPNPGVVIHPPVQRERCKTKPGKKITLINLCENKGGKFFNKLVELMPDYEFLGVEGAYGKQEKVDLPNITYMKNTPDVKKIYSQTRILLMPSMSESYGMTGIEAMYSGIPVIAAPTPGLKESLGDAGIFCSDSTLKWIEAIKAFDDLTYYKEVSKRCIQRTKDVEASVKKELEEMEVFLTKILKKAA